MITLTWLHREWWWTFPAALVVWVAWRLFARRRFVAFSAVRWVARLRYRPSPIRRLPHVLAVLGVALVLVALMDPALPYSEGEVRSQGLDIALVLDLSSSMQETMGLQRPTKASPPLAFSNRDTGAGKPQGRTRLETTKEALRDFISRRHDDRIGLVVFSDNAYVVAPLTFDYDYLRHYVDIVDDQILRGEGMTAIGDGIALANYLLAKMATDETRNKVIVVFTDGENNFGRDPLLALDAADAAGVRVHVIGVDLEEDVKQKPAVRALIDAVKKHGGQYYDADTARQLRAAYSNIDAIEKGLLTSKSYNRNTPVYDWFTIPAILFLVAAVAVRAIPFFADFT